MKKAAVFAAAAVLGLASAAQAVTVTFSGLGLTNANPVNDQAQGANNYSLDYSANARFWNNSDSYYAAGQGIADVSYAEAFGGTWSVTITASAGNEILLDGFRLVRPSSGTGAAGGSDDNTTVVVDGASNDKSEATNFTNHVFTVNYATNQARGTAVTLSFADGTVANGGDFALDQYSFTVQPIPEPTVLAPMALAGMGMFLRRRRA